MVACISVNWSGANVVHLFFSVSILKRISNHTKFATLIVALRTAYADNDAYQITVTTIIVM